MRWSKKILVALALSGGLNLFLLVAVGWCMVASDQLPPLKYRPVKRQEVTSSLAEALVECVNMDGRQLVAMLNDHQRLSHGYSQRDIALACLVSFHDFDLERALGREPIERRLVEFNDAPVQLFPRLNENQYASIAEFASVEKWPLTTYGLYRKLAGGTRDSVLVDSFSETPEFRAMELLFARSGAQVGSLDLLGMVLEGGWEVFDRFDKQQQVELDLSADRCRDLLMDYIASGSQAATEILLEHGDVLPLETLTDDEVLLVIDSLNTPTPAVKQFLAQMMGSPRSRTVWKAASERLHLMSAQPSSGWHADERAQAALVYEVVDGDSLWKVARRFETSVAKIKELNGLTSDSIRPGQTLQIPD